MGKRFITCLAAPLGLNEIITLSSAVAFFKVHNTAEDD